VLTEGTIQIENPNPNTLLQRKKLKMSPEYSGIADKVYPPKMKPNSQDAKILISSIHRSIRRANEFKQEKMGIESKYVCAYTDCNNIINAEANAANNAGIKLLSQLSIG
jgi:hypothetical protein